MTKHWHQPWCDVQKGGSCSCPNGTYDPYNPLRNRWGVRMEDGTIHGFLFQGDAENLEVITGGQLVAWVNNGWEDVE